MGVNRCRRLVESGMSGWVRRGLSGPTSDTLRLLAADNNWQFLQADVVGANTSELLFDALAEQLELPDFFGRNWDALLDCLRDLGGTKHGVIVRLKGLPTLPAALVTPFVEVLATRMDEVHDGESTPMIVVSDPPLPNLQG